MLANYAPQTPIYTSTNNEWVIMQTFRLGTIYFGFVNQTQWVGLHADKSSSLISCHSWGTVTAFLVSDLCKSFQMSHPTEKCNDCITKYLVEILWLLDINSLNYSWPNNSITILYKQLTQKGQLV